MKKHLNKLRPIWKLFGSAKFAIGILLIFAIAMIWGTVLESRYGTAYAVKKVYFSWWFLTIQFFILISLIVAVIDRMPFKKRLLGFYVVHAGIVIIILGSVLTRMLGIDGQLVVKKGQPSRFVKINEDILYFQTREKLNEIDFTKNPFKKDSILYQDEKYAIKKLEYIPYASSEVEWVDNKEAWSSEWIVKNSQTAEKLTFSFPENSLFSNQASLGPLKITVIEYEELLKTTKPTAPAIEVVYENKQVFSFSEKTNMVKRNLKDNTSFELRKVEQIKTGLIFYEIQYEDKVYKFFPRFSIYPIKEHLEVDKNSPFTLKRTQDLPTYGKTHVLLSSDKNNNIFCAFQKNNVWQVKEYRDSPIKLPWMELELNLQKNRINQKPRLRYQAVDPQKEAEKNIQAMQIEIKDSASDKSIQLWVSDQIKEEVELNGQKIKLFISSRMIELPFSIELQEFKMETNPGTMEAATYESFVISEGEKFHIYMNHPMKKMGYTLYQSSYYQNESGEYESVLSVNKDPGREVKYFGSLLLVIGLILHYLIVHKRIFYA